ncbi:unnamed protein product [Acanthoscelides obtectus]|uniref:Uncharacterized protein n=2 Tax=Acanthoscelides obtectus TaxID=200917 RepID=A0A9P0LUK1_ACAOB|nr:unnamed protein product [Acanthoscelides obtectus]CAK1670203.1 hypothetical protein AOBTE_LOCUS27470 [Acanthoscelides obtectus]
MFVVHEISLKRAAILLGKLLSSDCCEKAENDSDVISEVLEKIIDYAEKECPFNYHGIENSHFSDCDPNYVPTDDSAESADEAQHVNNNKPKLKRKMAIKNKECKKRLRKDNEWMDNKAKKQLNLGNKHENRVECTKSILEPMELSLQLYGSIGKFNIAFFKPKKDQCQLCTAYKDADNDIKLNMQEQYDQHLANKGAVRNLKDVDKELATNDKSLCVACFDLQKVLVTPPSEVSTLHYKTKIATYNFTVYDIEYGAYKEKTLSKEEIAKKSLNRQRGDWKKLKMILFCWRSTKKRND